MARPDYYATLGVARTATDGEIKAAFRRLARELHPDTRAGESPDPAAEKRFKAVSRAYDTLSRPAKRRAYDHRRERGRFGGPGSGPSSYQVETGAALYHSDLGHHSDFYQAGDPLSVTEAALAVGRDAGWLRRMIRSGRLSASRGPTGYLLRRRDVERLDRTARRRRPAPEPELDPDVEAAAES